MPPETLRPLFDVPGVAFYSLQRGGDPAPADFPLIDLMGNVTDFADTAALIECLDLVIAVDTGTAHLAGAMGKPVWLMDRFANEWRWGVDRTDSYWYDSMRIYRQAMPGDWGGVVAAVGRDLRELVSQRAGSSLNSPISKVGSKMINPPSQEGFINNYINLGKISGVP